eukprot:CAMPEP_0183351080 /NCGR_PEP_ID=MMETSP0164_2-20130417/23351_1 /TAXON_ID=221442 /ORGANISM="Coccolithus pelagicus ssp braarudi, Strain PLY182g" /LENGTH=181 /DNA_ID=CAMNT_0025523179 /DNA_START=1 /DNA_END=549 /DNA_ORIENTATION=+
MLLIARRALALVPALALLPARPSLALTKRETSLAQLMTLRDGLVEVEAGTRSSDWDTALRVVSGRPFERATLEKAFDEYTEKPSAQETAMNNAAFIVYYEERRYSDTRLEPQEPGLRAKQNGFRREALSALDDLKAELRFIKQEAAAGRLPDDEEVADVQRYVNGAREAVAGYLSLTHVDL